MTKAIHTSHPYSNQIQIFLIDLRNSGIQTRQLTEMAYEWCSLVWGDRVILTGEKHPLLLSLEIGFRHIGPRGRWIEAKLTHKEQHQKLAGIVFGSWDGEAVADLLHAWTSEGEFHHPYPALKICAEYLVNLHTLYPFSPRLRQSIIHTVELIGYQPFEQAGVEVFIGLLNDLQVCPEDVVHVGEWTKILLGTIQSSKGVEYLSLTYYRWLVALVHSWPCVMENNTYNPSIMVYLENAGEWDKLLCWVAVVWIVWPPGDGQTTEEDLKHAMFSLLYQQSDSIQELGGMIGRWGSGRIESFQQISKWVCEQVQQAAE